MKRTLCLFAALMGLIVFSNAQSSELPNTIEKGQLTTTDGQKISFTNLIADPEKYSYKNTKTGQNQIMLTDRVLSIEQQAGTEAGKWALITGAAGLLGSILGVLEATGDASYYGAEVDKSKIVPIVLGITAGSALIGVAIGSGKKKYKTIFSNPKYDTTYLSAPTRISLTSSTGQGFVLSLRHRF